MTPTLFHTTLANLTDTVDRIERMLNDPDPAARLTVVEVAVAAQITTKAASLLRTVAMNTASEDAAELVNHPYLESLVRHTLQDANQL